MTIEDLMREIRVSSRALSLAICTTNLLAGWVPDDNNINIISNDRVMKAIYIARQIVYDAEVSAVARELK